MFLGVDGIKGTIADMRELGVWDTFQVKTQTMKTAIESACMLLRIDDIVSGLQNKWCVCWSLSFFLLCFCTGCGDSQVTYTVSNLI